ncbi:hypothetical protein H0H81_003345 [Sphagnurus paluster]|uniref:Transketolase-like pyrimidine-binding domain-containing protein n=1 Tax=Sphagnurus paluster TaxID=117069 RepID=A0A9P7KHA4_9AGAR|nr:hypothetical protein H0H81_003345 [Sphagnurus paluster]
MGAISTTTTDTEKLVLETIRALAADLTQAFKGGHPGTAMGATAIGFALWHHLMVYNPKNPNWYASPEPKPYRAHRAGSTTTDWCSPRATRVSSSASNCTSVATTRGHSMLKSSIIIPPVIAAGHPEIEFPGIELTTGLLGRGIANAVGLAMASKHLAASFNKPDFPIVDNTIWCFTRDGCLQEGVGQEALSLAGHLGLGNLVVICDDNSVIATCFTDDTNAKMRAVGFEVIDVEDGTNDLHGIIAALKQAKRNSILSQTQKQKPTFVHIRTIIGYGSRKANSGAAHGAALGEEEVKILKDNLQLSREEKFVIPQQVYDYNQSTVPEGADSEARWTALLANYATAYPELYAELIARLTPSPSSSISPSSGSHEEHSAYSLPTEHVALLPPKSQLPSAPQATRKTSGIVVQALAPRFPALMLGSADLCESTFVHWDGMKEFQDPSTGLGYYTGRQIWYGIREFAMIGVANGMNAYQNGMIIPICSSYFQFWLYAAPAARMSALQGLRFIGVATHDSIGVGEDGPTHQSIA